MKIFFFSLMISSVSWASGIVTCTITTVQPDSVFAPFQGGTITANFINGQVLLKKDNLDRRLNFDQKISSFKVEQKFCQFQQEDDKNGANAMFSCTEKKAFGADNLTTVWMSFDAREKNGGYQEVYFNGSQTSDPYLLFDSCL